MISNLILIAAYLSLTAGATKQIIEEEELIDDKEKMWESIIIFTIILLFVTPINLLYLAGGKLYCFLHSRANW